MIKLIGQDTVISRSTLYAESFFQRLTGMLTRKFSDSLDGIVFRNCNAVHTFGMRFDIDVIFVDRTNRITEVYPDVKPWRTRSSGTSKAVTIELPSGSIAKFGIKCGDFVEFS